ncbi:carbon-nitrogen hydrolase family protein [Allosphingosinicella deserti]|uniref:Carbon-nitrogen hydrolase family protein n=1 Tax=Allosphingosinicella deserti TaxID=2116704 RepID=A0A2P7QZL9_9SPHN|nr:carbon-nitrogen hydrolase family protein [Sphingomonas deserti]PSJ43410.1 carbon-nitrogen hydrolase family protein [Sphingomonas deserti]
MTIEVKRVAVVQWEDGLIPVGDEWTAIEDSVRLAGPDILVTNELPFGSWIAAWSWFDQELADRSVADHAAGMAALRALQVPAIVSSRPVMEDERLANEAVLIDPSGVRGFHRKQYYPNEPGWYEANWYGTQARDFSTFAAAGLELGVLLCTEAMFNEHARAYGRAGAHLIAIPRATGSSVEDWHLAGRMAALVSGCYVVSSNRVGSGTHGGPLFGGEGFAYAPDGQLLGITTAESPLFVFELNPAMVRDARKLYPRYVAERS